MSRSLVKIFETAEPPRFPLSAGHASSALPEGGGGPRPGSVGGGRGGSWGQAQGQRARHFWVGAGRGIGRLESTRHCLWAKAAPSRCGCDSHPRASPIDGGRRDDVESREESRIVPRNERHRMRRWLTARRVLHARVSPAQCGAGHFRWRRCCDRSWPRKRCRSSRPARVDPDQGWNPAKFPG